MLVVLVFFRDIRNTIVTVAGLPVIMIGTFAAISLFGVTINLVSLLALSLSVGLVIDDAIVVRENIFRQMERGADTARGGQPRHRPGGAFGAGDDADDHRRVLAGHIHQRRHRHYLQVVRHHRGLRDGDLAGGGVYACADAFGLLLQAEEGSHCIHAAGSGAMTEHEDVLDEANEKLGADAPLLRAHSDLEPAPPLGGGGGRAGCVCLQRLGRDRPEVQVLPAD